MSEAVKLWAAAALAGNTDAEVEYAIALYNGDGTPRDEDAAAQIFFKAAKQGSPIAQDRYARILASGLGAPRDPVKAVKWHLVSRAGGETDITLDDFMAKLDPASVAEGTKQAQPWLAALKAKQAAMAAQSKAEQAPPALGLSSGTAGSPKK
jgi:TPR repeat protein